MDARQKVLTLRRKTDVEQPPNLVLGWRVIRKRRGTVFTAFSVLFGVVLIGSLIQKPVYRAKAVLEIDRENPGLVDRQGLVQFEEVTDEYLETQYKVLNSDDLADRVIRQLHLDQVEEFRPSAPPWLEKVQSALARVFAPHGNPSADANALLEETVLERFQTRLDVKPIRRSRAVEINFDSHDPQLAARIVSAVASNYMRKNLEARWDAAQKASEWLSQQLQDLKTKLEASENTMQRYAADNGLLMLESDNGTPESPVNQNLLELQDELNHAQDARYEKESLYRLVQSADASALPGVLDDKLAQDLGMRLADLQREHAQLAATFTESYPRVAQTESEIKEVEAALDLERRRATQKITYDYNAALRREKLLEQALTEKKLEANTVAEKSVQYGILRRDVETNKTLYEGLLQRLKEAGVSAGLAAINIRIIDPGKIPYWPVEPKMALNLSLAAILGLALGAGAAFFREHLDQTIRDANDVDRHLRAPVLASIPSLDSMRRLKIPGLDRSHRGFAFSWADSDRTGRKSLIIRMPGNDAGIPPTPLFSEAFRELRTSLLLSSASQSAHTILVTSAQSGEGKTTVAVNLAVSLAQLGRRTLLIDTDMRRPSIHKYFPGEGSALSQFLAGEGDWKPGISQTPVSGLDVLPAGSIPSNPAELLSSDQMRTLLQEASGNYRFVVLDSPPLITVADSRILASRADSTILVVKCEETPRQVVQFAESQARAAGANLLGVVLNQLDLSKANYPYPSFVPYGKAASQA